MKLPYRLTPILLSAFVAACGSGSSSSSSSGAGSSTHSGQFVDSPVSGLSYRRGNSPQPYTTNANGEFQYSPGQSVHFFLGGIELGSAAGSAFITPETLAAGNEQISTGIARFLLTLDADSNRSGIQITPQVRKAAESKLHSLSDFANLEGSGLADFAKSANNDGERSLVSAKTARDHLAKTLKDIADGHFDNDGGVDSDGDGVNDAVDSCPATPANATVDVNGCAENQASEDFDKDGITNTSDNCPQDKNADQLDTDGDSRGDACDWDDDGDGLGDSEDPAPLNTDKDGDGHGDGADNCPIDSNADQTDTDGDGLGNECDSDDDNDGVSDNDDVFPLDPTETTDSDRDGVGDNSDAFPNDPNEQYDTDGDGTGDNADAFPNDPNEQVDTDGDGTGNNADTDDDNDNVVDDEDNCPLHENEDQTNTDGADDGGDACDNDDDNDGISDIDEVANGTNPLKDDTDDDGHKDGVDNCPIVANEDQTNTDADFEGGDDHGDACDADDDADGVNDDGDAFPTDPDEQYDTDRDGIGENADTDDDGDTVADENDYCPSTPAEATVYAGEGANATNSGCSDEQLAAGAWCSDDLKNGSSFTKNANHSYHVPLAVKVAGVEQISSFEVFEPAEIHCDQLAAGAHPLILEGHGFGGSRQTSRLDGEGELTAIGRATEAGYAAISIDQRGFGDSTGTVRVMDPDYEGQYLLEILDWAEQNLPYLAWRDEASGEFVARPTGTEDAPATSVAGGDNLVVGAIGGSYGGGYQLLILTVDAKKRLDAIQPDIAWHDLRNSLNPGDAVKSLWDLVLVGGGEAGSYSPGLENRENPENRGLDPIIKETLARGIADNQFPRAALDWFHSHGLGYWCAKAGLPAMPYKAYGDDSVPMLNTPTLPADGTLIIPNEDTKASHFAGLSVLLTQGMPDTLFNFNEAWWNLQCLSAAGADVVLHTHNGGHAIFYAQAPEGPETPVSDASCAPNVLTWFDSKLKPAVEGQEEAQLEQVCLALGEGESDSADTITFTASELFGTGGKVEGFTALDVNTAVPVPNGYFAAPEIVGVLPIAVELGTVAEGKEGILAGIARLNVKVSTPGGEIESALDCPLSEQGVNQAGCDSITFVGLGVKLAGAQGWELIDDQLTALRGLGEHSVDLVGVAERLREGDSVGLLFYGQHAQFVESFSRDSLIPAVTVSGSVDLPLYGVDEAGQPDAGSASSVLDSGEGNGVEGGSEQTPNPQTILSSALTEYVCPETEADATTGEVDYEACLKAAADNGPDAPSAPLDPGSTIVQTFCPDAAESLEDVANKDCLLAFGRTKVSQQEFEPNQLSQALCEDEHSEAMQNGRKVNGGTCYDQATSKGAPAPPSDFSKYCPEADSDSERYALNCLSEFATRQAPSQ